MKKFVIFFPLLFLIQILYGQYNQSQRVNESNRPIINYFNLNPDLLSLNSMNSVIKIKAKEQGSGFIIKFDSSTFLVTARHLFDKSIKDNSEITFEYFKFDRWNKMHAKILLHPNPNVDIAIFELPNENNIYHLVLKRKFALFVSDYGYMVGFPYNFSTDDPEDFFDGFEIPFVKSFVISGQKVNNGVITLYLDGFNNPGFSGGPILNKNRANPSDSLWYVSGVVSSYVADIKKIMLKEKKINYYENSGIIVATGSYLIVEIIDNHRK